MIEDAKKPFVACEKFTEFHVAEEKHQKNALKRHPGSQIHILQIEVESTIQHPRRNMAVETRWSTLTGLYRCLSWEESVTCSHVATRLNGYVAGHGSMAAFNREWRQLGLSTRIAEYVRSVIIKRG